jgi:putative membrane protein
MMVMARGNMTVNMLTPLGGAAFDTAYVNSQVQMHGEALMLLEQRPIPSAQSAMLRSELTAIRASVVMHLAAARALQPPGGDGGADAAAGN